MRRLDSFTVLVLLASGVFAGLAFLVLANAAAIAQATTASIWTAPYEFVADR